MPTSSSRRRSGSKSARRVKKTMKRRSRVPKILLTLLGIGIPASLALPLAWKALSLRDEHQVTLACSAIAVGSFLLSWAMSLHERSCCYTRKMRCSWCLFSVIVVLCILILFVELTDLFAWGSDIENKDRNKWSSIGFGVAGPLMLVSFLLNWFYICRCLRKGRRSEKEDGYIKRKRSQKINGFHQHRRSTRRSYSHSQSKRRRRHRSERQRSQSASAVVARVSDSARAGSKSNAHIVEMNSSWLNGSSGSRSKSRRGVARPLRLHSIEGRRGNT